jgi:DNA repair protein SbcD/Mre11
MKFIHTADVHLDRCFSDSGMPVGFGNRRRQSLRDVFQEIVRRAGEWPADALIIAGDLYDADRVSRDTIAFLMSEFKSIPHVPVFIAPGNHDPMTPDSPYALEAWPVNVTIFGKPVWESVELASGLATVHGFGFDGLQISRNPFGELLIDPGQKDRIHIAVGHGSELGHQPPDKAEYAPFRAADAAVPGLNYLALGHFHSITEVSGDFASTVYYSGSPEGLSFRETGPRYYLEVEIEDGKVDVTPVRSSRIVYADETIECDLFESSQEVIEAIRAIARDLEGRAIARIALTGTCDPAIQNEIGLIYDSASIDFEYLRLTDETAPSEDYEELAREDTSLGNFTDALNMEIASTDDAEKRRTLERARELGVAAFRQRAMEIRGLERG